MKIVLTGTICTGKSTVINKIKDPRVGVIHEIAREILTQNPALEKHPQLQDILFYEQTTREKMLESKLSVVLCDRSIIDNIAHSRMFGVRVKNEWEKWLHTYNKILFFEKEEVPFDPRSRDALKLSPRGWHEYRDALDAHIKQTLHDYQIAHDVVIGSEIERTRMVQNELQNYFLGIEGNRIFKET